MLGRYLFSSRKHRDIILPRRCFISHAYKDVEEKGRLLHLLPKGVTPVIFEPIEVPPTKRVSDDVVRAINRCTGLIFVDGEYSRRSFWVSFEKDYARRRKKPSFRFDDHADLFEPDTSPPVDPFVFFSYAHTDARFVRQIGKWLMRNRNFNPIVDDADLSAKPSLSDEITKNIERASQGDGCFVVFLSKQAVKSKWVEHELKTITRINHSRRLIVWLDSPEEVLREANIDRELIDSSEVPVVAARNQQIDWNQVDNLIVRVFHLVTTRN
jgi:hypothetical protein